MDTDKNREARKAEARKRYFSMTERRWRGLELVAEGLKTKEAADEMQVSVSTAKNEIREACAALGGVNRAHAIAIAKDEGLI